MILINIQIKCPYVTLTATILLLQQNISVGSDAFQYLLLLLSQI
jgi:hypothetical protein